MNNILRGNSDISPKSNLSAMLLAEHVKVLLWCFFLGLNVTIEVVLYLFPSSKMSVSVLTSEMKEKFSGFQVSA